MAAGDYRRENGSLGDVTASSGLCPRQLKTIGVIKPRGDFSAGVMVRTVSWAILSLTHSLNGSSAERHSHRWSKRCLNSDQSVCR